MRADRETIGRLAIIAVFLSLLVLPIAQMLTSFPTVAPLAENRSLAEAPPIDDILRPAQFTAALQRWFTDHYGLRDLLIRLKTQMDYSLFGVSDRVHIGHDGWLFYRSVIDKEEPLVEAMSDADLDRTVQGFARLRDWLAARGIRLVVVTNQVKDRFYREYLPRTAARALHRHRFDDFRARLHAVPGLTYIDTTDTLLRLKRQRPIFHKTDFHWNDPAAFVVAARLVDEIAAMCELPVPFWRYNLAITERAASGGQAQFMPLLQAPSEQALHVQPTWPDAHLTTIANQEPFEVITHAPPGEQRLPATVVFGDSFFDGMIRSGLADYFQSMARARTYHAPLVDVLRAIPPGTKVFILQFLEISLPAFRTIELP